MEVAKVLVLSTAHLIDLDLSAEDGDFGNHRAIEHEYGYVVFTALERDEQERNLMLLETPEWLRPILQLAWSEDCAYINFDSDVEPLPQLINYEGVVTEEINVSRSTSSPDTNTPN